MLIKSGRAVSIVLADFASLDAEDLGGAGLAAALGVATPPSWPPLHNGPETRDLFRAMMREHPTDTAFCAWYILAEGTVVGTCGFMGPPDADGAVGIGYAVIEEAQRKGYATEAVGLLLQHAFADARVTEVRAETLADGIASQKVLANCGFVATGNRVDPDEGAITQFARRRN